MLLNYFGQAAHLLADPSAVHHPFSRLFPPWALIPMVILASAATIIASQAVISGAFSMTSQAVQMGYLPRMQIRHTSASERGQIYVPKINFLLLIAVLALVLGFKSSGNLGAAYGIAVTGTMTLTTSLALLYMIRVRHWNPFLAGGLFGLFLLVDLSFFGANMLKVAEGGWAPLLIGVTAFLIMSTWTTGRQAIMARRSEESLPLDMFLSGLKPDRPVRVSGTALFLTSDVDKVPASLLHNLKHNKVLHERVVLLSIKTLDIPRVPDDQRLEIRDVGHNFHTIVTRYGFVEEPDIWRVLAQCRTQDLNFNLMETSVFVGREKLVISDHTPAERTPAGEAHYSSTLLCHLRDLRVICYFTAVGGSPTDARISTRENDTLRALAPAGGGAPERRWSGCGRRAASGRIGGGRGGRNAPGRGSRR